MEVKQCIIWYWHNKIRKGTYHLKISHFFLVPYRMNLCFIIVILSIAANESLISSGKISNQNITKKKNELKWRKWSEKIGRGSERERQWWRMRGGERDSDRLEGGRKGRRQRCVSEANELKWEMCGRENGSRSECESRLNETAPVMAVKQNIDLKIIYLLLFNAQYIFQYIAIFCSFFFFIISLFLISFLLHIFFFL